MSKSWALACASSQICLGNKIHVAWGKGQCKWGSGLCKHPRWMDAHNQAGVCCNRANSQRRSQTLHCSLLFGALLKLEKYCKAQYKEKQRSKVMSKQHLNQIICTAALSLWQHGEIKATRLLKHASLMWRAHFSQAHYRFWRFVFVLLCFIWEVDRKSPMLFVSFICAWK